MSFTIVGFDYTNLYSLNVFAIMSFTIAGFDYVSLRYSIQNTSRLNMRFTIETSSG